jgi:transcriptional regulator with XRE-family HTH domain
MEQTPETELAARLSMMSQSELANRSGESKQAVSDMVNGRRTISAKMLDYLGFERVTIVRKKGKTNG